MNRNPGGIYTAQTVKREARSQLKKIPNEYRARYREIISEKIRHLVGDDVLEDDVKPLKYEKPTNLTFIVVERVLKLRFGQWRHKNSTRNYKWSMFYKDDGMDKAKAFFKDYVDFEYVNWQDIDHRYSSPANPSTLRLLEGSVYTELKFNQLVKTLRRWYIQRPQLLPILHEALAIFTSHDPVEWDFWMRVDARLFFRATLLTVQLAERRGVDITPIPVVQSKEDERNV